MLGFLNFVNVMIHRSGKAWHKIDVELKFDLFQERVHNFLGAATDFLKYLLEHRLAIEFRDSFIK